VGERSILAIVHVENAPQVASKPDSLPFLPFSFIIMGFSGHTQRTNAQHTRRSLLQCMIVATFELEDPTRAPTVSRAPTMSPTTGSPTRPNTTLAPTRSPTVGPPTTDYVVIVVPANQTRIVRPRMNGARRRAGGALLGVGWLVAALLVFLR
jgi:hypothetical protein